MVPVHISIGFDGAMRSCYARRCRSLGGVIPGLFVRPLRSISPLTITPVATVTIHFFRLGYIARFPSEASAISRSFQFPFVATSLIALALANARFQKLPRLRSTRRSRSTRVGKVHALSLGNPKSLSFVAERVVTKLFGAEC